MVRRIQIRITTALPIEVDGGRTRWRLYIAYGGKNMKEAALIAKCSRDGNQITIVEGRAGYVERAAANPLSAPAETLLARIFRKMVRDGTAVIVPEHDAMRRGLG